jgi:MYXO-CTERM domain-containing protein
VTRFTSPGACSESDSGDVDVVSESYTYTRFGAVESITYSDGTTLEWAYDPYQRLACFADALATTNGHHCPASPVDVGFAPDPSELLTYYVYWPDSDTYRRGLLQSKCRGVPDGSGGFVTKCMDTDYYTSADVGGACSAALSSIVGAFASMVKSETYCSGGSCNDGGSLVYRTTYQYDPHRRPCQVESRNAAGAVIFSSAYGYDQFDNVVHEANTSDVDSSNDSNYQIDYTYDGLLRLIEENRQDLSGSPIKDTTYEYDAASNLTRKIDVEPDVGGEATPTPTESSTVVTPPSPTATPTSPPATATSSPTPTVTTHSGGGGCQVGANGGASWLLLLPIALAALLRRRRQPARAAVTTRTPAR